MSLKEYRRKRDFRKTSEPAGNGRPRAAKVRQFVVQKHDASRLHYDFRLEYDGTLKSWAVPKGPSLDPAKKSLAVQVEDHPLEYAEFEGIIPEGEYGGGTVMVWDHGTWEPEDDPDRGFRDGKLKFQLHGEKLEGSWALVRMSGKAGDGGKNWLLIKHRDKAARPNAKTNFLARHARSVLSGRKIEEIAAGADRTWSSKQKSAKPPKAMRGDVNASPITTRDIAQLANARKAPLPRTFKPQLATLTDAVPTGDNWLHELKFDGYRILAFLQKGRVRLVSRNGKDWTRRFPTIADALGRLALDSTLLDGEIVSLDAKGRSDFQTLQNLLRRRNDTQLVYYIFDAPHLMGYDLTDTPLVERKQALSRVLLSQNSANDGPLRYSDHIQGEGVEVFAQACAARQEGIIAKRADSHYSQSRTKSWLKVKCHQRQEFVIGGFTKPEGSRIGFGALLLGHYNNGELVYSGRVGTGFSDASLRDITRKLKERTRESPPFANPPTGAEARGVRWVRPDLVGEVKFTEWTDDGRLRHPSFQGLRSDKPARDIVREEPEMPPTRQAKRTSTAKRSRRTSSQSTNRGDATVAGVRISSPDRVVYPEMGITKLDLAHYYEQVADWILPYVVKRPLTLVRCPQGSTGKCFYQKHWTESLPDAVDSVMVVEKEEAGKKAEREPYVVIRDLAGLVSLVQMGVLEMHPWPARTDKLERPDMLVFDLDPGEGVAWPAVVQGAKDVRDLISDLGLRSYLRTSGGKGLHVVVPIVRRSTWDETKEFARAVAEKMVRDDSSRYIATMSKAKRRGKVFVDYLRNQRGATAIASYSTRARPGAPVATPVAWDELSSRLKPNKYTVKNLHNRLMSLSADPWADFFDVRQSLTAKMLDVLSA